MDFLDLLDLTFSDPQHPFHLYHMEMALAEARLAGSEDEVPVGCVIVHRDRGLIARGHNQREQLQDPTAHAEMIALTQAASSLNSWRLEDCILYVTLEPCPMCAGAAVQARLPRIVYGVADPKAGACGSLFQIASDPRLNHRAEIVSGVLAAECGNILSDFFRKQRLLGKK
jgi:tRNA(adenine34) deaminase